MRNHLFAFIAGLLMSIGITYSQMIDPVKVKAFLDVTGHWDPTLLVVMVSALLTYGIGFGLIRGRKKPVFAPKFHLPEKREIDRPLVIGAVLFGAGWGLVGYCPGPAGCTTGWQRWHAGVCGGNATWLRGSRKVSTSGRH